MPRRKTPIMKTPARDVFAELELYAKDKQFYPVQNALFGHMQRKDYDITIGEFNYYFDRLVEEGYIDVDDDTRAIRATKLIIVDRDNADVDVEFS